MANLELWINWFTSSNYFWILKHLVGATTFFGLGTLGLLYKYQNSLIYQPDFPDGSRRKIDTPSKYDLPFNEVVITTADNVRLGAYLITRPEAQKDTPTLIYFHANAGNLGHRLPIAERLYHLLGCNILMLSYRGYGYSEGAPDEKGFKLDAEATLDFVVNHESLKDGKIVLYGQSIGGAVAIYTAQRFEDKIHGLIVENTFLSLPKLIPSVLPLLKFTSSFCHQIWDSEKAISEIKHTPTLFLSGENDSLIPPSHMKKLYETIPASTPKTFVSIPEGDHNDTCLKAEYFPAIGQFWNDHIKQ
ncbi:bem46 protein, variant [Entomophthora muscae]|uniref:Bem46 protein, variant n=1 Tax=Entomophthora muscae TaxID=34485 RepID=A0ACC2SK25_9FUNG|nr:bem46 protein, variant [Entomophthora muscae]